MRLIYDLFNFFLGVGVWVFGGLFHSSNHGMRKYESKQKEKEKNKKHENYEISF